MKKSKVYVHFVDNSTPKMKKFKTLKAAQSFVARFKKKHPDPDEGSWVEFILVGELFAVDSYYENDV